MYPTIDSMELKTKLSKLALEHKQIDLHTLLDEHGSIKETQIVEQLIPDLKVSLIHCSRISHSLSSGKIYRYKVLALVGNQKGVIGFGAGKSKTRADANKKAIEDAKKNIICLKHLSVHNGYSLKTVTCCKKGSTLVTLTPLVGSSITASKRGLLYCRLAGLRGLKIVTGNKKRLAKGKVNCPYNYYSALHESVKKQLCLSTLP